MFRGSKPSLLLSHSNKLQTYYKRNHQCDQDFLFPVHSTTVVIGGDINTVQLIIPRRYISIFHTKVHCSIGFLSIDLPEERACLVEVNIVNAQVIDLIQLMGALRVIV